MANLRVGVAETEAARLRGFLGRTAIGENEALLFENTRFLHTFGMSTHIDIVFLGRNCKIVRIVHRAAPWRIFGSLRAQHAIELAAGAVARKGLVVGDLLALERKNVGCD